MNKKIFIALSALMLCTAVSCSDAGSTAKNSSGIKTEILGDIPTDSTDETSSEPITLTYAVMGEPDADERRLISKFNESDNGYIIELRDYSELAGGDENGVVVYDEEKQKAFKIKIMQDISNGEIDIVRDYYIGGSQNMDRLAARGAFVDLNGFLADDPEVNRTTLNSHILDLHETDGCLYTLPTYYKVETLVGLTKYVGSTQGWTLDEFISKWEQMPEGSTIQGHTEKNYVYGTILQGITGSFVDYKNAEAHFDSPQFRKALEFCNTFDNIMSEKVDPDMSAISFVNSRRLYGFANYHADFWTESGDTYTLTGYPSDDGCGGFLDSRGNRLAICASTSDREREGAWQFIRSFCLDDYQTSHYCQIEKMKIDGEVKDVYLEPVGFPINLEVYDKLSAEAMAGKHMDSTVSRSGTSYEMGQLTQDELNTLTAYINSISQLSSGVDNDLAGIINDEVVHYFNGERSLDDCIGNIQNRAAIMVSEKQ